MTPRTPDWVDGLSTYLSRERANSSMSCDLSENSIEAHLFRQPELCGKFWWNARVFLVFLVQYVDEARKGD